MRSVTLSSGAVVDIEPRCICNKLLFEYAARPWSHYCPRCHRPNASNGVALDSQVEAVVAS